MTTTIDTAKSKLTAEQVAEAEAAGKAWGEAEVELWRDQHEGESDLPDWTMGTYCGRIDIDDPDAREAYDYVLDCAARDAWNAAR